MRTRRMFGIWVWSLLAALALQAAAAPARAATEVLYVGATGHYVRGVFRDFWDKNGGLANFGYPITEEYIDPQTNRVYQYFERARFERASPAAITVDVRLRDRPFRYAAPEDFDEVVDEAGEDAVDVCLHDGAGLIASLARCRRLLTDNPQTPLPRPR